MQSNWDDMEKTKFINVISWIRDNSALFKSLNLSTEQEKLVTDLNLTESKSANTDKDVEMSDPEKSPKRDVLEDVDMSNIDNEEEEMEANPNLNQSRISDYFPPTK